MGDTARLTVIVTTREGHALAEPSLRSVLADDAVPFDLVFVDIEPPPEAAAALRPLCEARGFRYVRHERWIAPAAARKAALAGVTTPYVLFIDNDVLVEPGCVSRLLACAEETGAGLVGPLYLQGGDGAPLTIHMAGGRLHRRDDGALVSEEHLLAFQPLDRAEALTRGPVDSLEYHCLLARTDLVQAPGVISDDVLLVHEHIDVALQAAQRGAGVWLEPSARVIYQGLAPRLLSDLAFYRRRWAEAPCEESMAAFQRRWRLADPDRFHAGVRAFLRGRSAHIGFRHTEARADDLAAPMGPSELAQTRFALREQAIARGYNAGAIRALESACDFATLLFDGLYRPDGRPFLNHVIGTASALVRYDFTAEVVLAGLLHAAYSHRPAWFETAEVSRVLASGGAVDAIVRGLPHAKAQLAAGGEAGRLTLDEVRALAVEAANAADMLLAGEYRASGRPAEIGEAGLSLLADALALAGAPGLAATAATERGEGAQGGLFGQGPVHVSFRLDARNRRVAPVR